LARHLLAHAHAAPGGHAALLHLRLEHLREELALEHLLVERAARRRSRRGPRRGDRRRSRSRRGLGGRSVTRCGSGLGRRGRSLTGRSPRLDDARRALHDDQGPRRLALTATATAVATATRAAIPLSSTPGAAILTILTRRRGGRTALLTPVRL